jgi:hypothetical protein
MDRFQLWAQPWWVNLLILIPLLIFLLWRRRGLHIRWQKLVFAALFGLSFGFVEASVVVYLRAATGLLPGYQGTLAEVRQHSGEVYDQSRSPNDFPQSLLAVEVFREAATILMLISLAWVAADRARERWAVFLWTFAAWDIAYYAGLWLTVRWPRSVREVDVLFLIPEPWIAQVWFPLLVSGLTMVAILASRGRASANSSHFNLPNAR